MTPTRMYVFALLDDDVDNADDEYSVDEKGGVVCGAGGSGDAGGSVGAGGSGGEGGARVKVVDGDEDGGGVVMQTSPTSSVWSQL